jgi:N6-adenosine-specific RNA methylase IME4
MKQKRAEREATLARALLALPKIKFAVIAADPPWRFVTRSAKGLDSSSPDNHYATSELSEIKALDVASISADDCVLFLWATVPMTPQALEVMAAWGFRCLEPCLGQK